MIFEQPNEVRGDSQSIHFLLVGCRHGPHEAQHCCHEQRLHALGRHEGRHRDHLSVRYPGRLRSRICQMSHISR